MNEHARLLERCRAQNVEHARKRDGLVARQRQAEMPAAEPLWEQPHLTSEQRVVVGRQARRMRAPAGLNAHQRSMASAYRRSASPCASSSIRYVCEPRSELSRNPSSSLRSITRGAFTPRRRASKRCGCRAPCPPWRAAHPLRSRCRCRGRRGSSGGSSRPRRRWSHLEITCPEQLRQPVFQLFEPQIARGRAGVRRR